MSQENVEVVRAAIEAYNRGDLESVLTAAPPDFEIDLSRAAGPLHGVYRLDQVRQLVVPWTMHLIGRDGIEVQARVTWTWTIRDGNIKRPCLYQERQEALEAVGLSE
jgi:ketosteroid isomerase-like protein